MNDYTIMYSENLLAVATLWQEARGVTNDDAVLGVCHVIRNRMERHYTSDGTVAGTVLAPMQFSGWNPGSRVAAQSLLSAMGDKRLLALWLRSNLTSDITNGAVLYFSPDAMGDRSNPSWATQENYACSIGPFDFYKG